MAAPARSTRPLQSVSPPRQARSEDTLRRILDAAASLIEEQGHRDLSIAEVARRAGSSVGGFYARFRSKDELLRAVEEDFFQRLVRLLDEMTTPDRWRDATATQIIRGLIHVLIDTHRRYERLILAFVARAVRDPGHHVEVFAFRRQVGERLSALAVARRDLVAHPDPAFAAEFAVQAVFGILQAQLLRGLVGGAERPLADDALARELERLVLAYLGIPPETVSPEGASHGR